MKNARPSRESKYQHSPNKLNTLSLGQLFTVNYVSIIKQSEITNS